MLPLSFPGGKADRAAGITARLRSSYFPDLTSQSLPNINLDDFLSALDDFLSARIPQFFAALRARLATLKPLPP
jgi:hypothetical protein